MNGEAADAFVSYTAGAIEVFAIIVLLAGILLTILAGAAEFRRSDAQRAFRTVRQWLGRTILLALELLVAADIIGTVALEPTISNLIVLAGIVLIRTFLSLSLEVEIEGRWPWSRQKAAEAA